MTTIDKDLYRDAYQRHREWNEAELKARLQRADAPSPQQTWQQYLSLWEFGWRLNLKPGQWQQREKQEALVRYYHRVKKT